MKPRHLLPPLFLVALLLFFLNPHSPPECAQHRDASPRPACEPPPLSVRRPRAAVHSAADETNDSPNSHPMPRELRNPAGTPPHPPPPPAARELPPSPPWGAVGAQCRAFSIEADVDLLHGDMSPAPVSTAHSLEECCGLCERTAGCKGLTLTPSGDCWLKDSISTPAKQRGLVSATRRGLRRTASPPAEHPPAAAVRPAAAQLDGPAAAAPASVARSGEAAAGGACGGRRCMPSPALVVMTHARADMLRRSLEQLQGMALRDRFTVYVSDDGGNQKVREVAAATGFVREVLTYPPRPPGSLFASSGLGKIAAHFHAALDAVLVERNHSHVVMVEDDLLLSPDFLRLFWQSAWLLEQDPSLWCVSAWNDQSFPHTATDARQLLRTDYFPGLGWMIRAATWHELRQRWPRAPTTGWDHWMRLSATSRGRECVVPRINRSRHANAHGTNVRDNRPFERFSFERHGVDDFGDLAYLLRDRYETGVEQSIRRAQRRVWPEAWGGGTALEAAKPWMGQVKSTELLVYTREQYRELARPLGIWAEAPRATHNGTISLQTAGGGVLLLADRRHCPYLELEEKLTPAPGDRPIAAVEGVSCDDTCAHAGGKCDPRTLEWGNNCETMQAHFPCEAGCGHQVGSELPAYASSTSLDTYQQCLVSDISISQCGAKYSKTRRLCFCSFSGT
ncbi:hypothetical protein AB1Y20_010768 [Prymnesium parvum]|uniref:alpha-1,3-mannosyl-glycoprotein 2-beta-N-acetylglucosaminyltransferase n=1 Tax=Prymnesium parvum TaxID=97485 RepID=A0AB34ISA3_PRYPA